MLYLIIFKIHKSTLNSYLAIPIVHNSVAFSIPFFIFCKNADCKLIEGA